MEASKVLGAPDICDSNASCALCYLGIPDTTAVDLSGSRKTSALFRSKKVMESCKLVVVHFVKENEKAKDSLLV